MRPSIVEALDGFDGAALRSIDPRTFFGKRKPPMMTYGKRAKMKLAFMGPTTALRGIIERCVAPTAVERFDCGASLLEALRDCGAASVSTDSGITSADESSTVALALHNLGVAFSDREKYLQAIEAHDAAAERATEPEAEAERRWLRPRSCSLLRQTERPILRKRRTRKQRPRPRRCSLKHRRRDE